MCSSCNTLADHACHMPYMPLVIIVSGPKLTQFWENVLQLKNVRLKSILIQRYLCLSHNVLIKAPENRYYCGTSHFMGREFEILDVHLQVWLTCEHVANLILVD